MNKKKCRTLNSLSSRGPTHRVPTALFTTTCLWIYFDNISIEHLFFSLSLFVTQEKRELYQFLLIGLCRPLPLRCDNSYPGDTNRQIKEHFFPFFSFLRVIIFFFNVTQGSEVVVVWDIKIPFDVSVELPAKNLDSNNRKFVFFNSSLFFVCFLCRLLLRRFPPPIWE